jgi:hypothetical protein
MIGQVAQLQPLVNATAQLALAGATGTATPTQGHQRNSPITGSELRAQLRAQQQRNSLPQPRNSGPEKVAPVAATDATELRDLIALILTNDSEADRAEALSVAVTDPDAALTSFRALAADKQPD